MAFFERFGFGRKSRPVGTKLESGLDLDRSRRPKDVLFKAGIFLLLVVLSVLAFRRAEVYQYTVEVGDIWTRETLTSPYVFGIYRTPESIEAERRQIRSEIPPYFQPIPDAAARIEANRDTLAAQLDRVFQAYADYRSNVERDRRDEAAADSLVYARLRQNTRLVASPAQWERLVGAFAERTPGIAAPSRQLTAGPRLDQLLLDRAAESSLAMIGLGVLDVPLDSIQTESIIVRDQRANTEVEVKVANLFGLNEPYVNFQADFEREFGSAENARLGSAFFRAIFQPSLAYMRGATLREWQRLMDRISPTEGVVQKDQVIVSDGDRITDEIKQRLISLERKESERTGNTMLWKQMLGQSIQTIAVFCFFFLYLFFLRRKIFDKNRHLLIMAILFSGIIGLYAFALRVDIVGLYAVPIAMVSILLTVMFDSRVGLFATITLALVGGLLLRSDFEFAFATIFAASLGIYSVRDIKNRGQFFVTAGIVFLGYVLILGSTVLIEGTPGNRYVSELFQIALNSFLIVLAYPLLWVFERFFHVTTDLTLLELSDTNRPLLKELSLKAPGTFNHTLQVANLAEAAADSVGAHALLTRVGALYHDIGKMTKAEYFVENQRSEANPHDQLKPRMSALIIASHVKDGVELGKQYALPKPVLDFIPMHHGTSLIEFFYHRAKEAAGEDSTVHENEFRYPGPKPDSRETGILMLADAVEAASRTLKDPTHKRLDALISGLIRTKLEDGQLDETDLTLRELTTIKDAFLALLVGMYHSRVRYPDQPAEEELDRIADAEKDEPQPQSESPDEDAPTPVGGDGATAGTL